MAQQGLKDLSFTFEAVGALKSAKLEYDPTLARGLDYYTGAIFEVKAAEGTMPGSICGGGRYDDLTGIFGLKNMSGVGISFGADRIYDVLLESASIAEARSRSARGRHRGRALSGPSEDGEAIQVCRRQGHRLRRDHRGE